MTLGISVKTSLSPYSPNISCLSAEDWSEALIAAAETGDAARVRELLAAAGAAGTAGAGAGAGAGAAGTAGVTAAGGAGEVGAAGKKTEAAGATGERSAGAEGTSAAKGGMTAAAPGAFDGDAFPVTHALLKAAEKEHWDCVTALVSLGPIFCAG